MPVESLASGARLDLAMARYKQCVILVGGLGTRLGSLTRELPKPMVEVGGRPFVEYLLHEVGRHGFRRVVLLAGYQASKLIGRFPSRCRVSQDIELEITHVVEPEPAGTAGALIYAAGVLDEEFLLLNGDSLFDFNLLDLRCRPVPGNWVAKVALRKIPNATRFGTVSLDGAKIMRFAERPAHPGPGIINGGVYWMKREILEMIDRKPCSLERDIFPMLVERGLCFGWTYSGFFIDIGLPEDLARAQDCLRDSVMRGAAFLVCDGVLNADDGRAHLTGQFRWIAGSMEAIKRLNDCGFLVFVVANQDVGQGQLTRAEARDQCGWINEQLGERGAHVDAFRYCSTCLESDSGICREVSDWRTLNPCILKDLAEHWPVRTAQSFLIGSRYPDIEAAQGAGLASYRFDGGDLQPVVADAIQDMLSTAVGIPTE
jgi:D-glycero-D-manno-heptose 1,7-bisphosphate phosphatase